MTFEHVPLLPTLRARWRQVLLTWAVIVAAVAGITLALPPRYEATATVLADVGGNDPIRGQAVFKPAGAVSTHLATQVDIIKSEEVALAVLRRLGLHEQGEWQELWRKETEGQGDFESWLAAKLQRRLAVLPSRDSNVVTLSYTSPDPAFSTAVVNAFVRSYIDVTLRMQVGPARQFNAFFEERAKPLREALERAKARLSAYEKQHKIVVAENEGSDVESTRLAELTSQLVTLQDELAYTANRRHQAAESPGNVEELRKDPEVLALTTELARQEGKLTELRSSFGDKHPAVMEAREAAKTLRRHIDGAMRRAAPSFDTPLKVNQARLTEMQKAIERQRQVVLERKSKRDAAAALLRDVQNAQRAYDAVLDRASQTALEGANTTQSNISVLKLATIPLATPLLAVNVLVAALIGLLLGIARAIVAEIRDRRVRTFDDITRFLQQPLLLALPDGNANGARAARRSIETRQRLVSGRPRLALRR